MNKFEVAIVSSKGQIVIPATFRKILGIRPDTKFMVLSDGHNLLLKPFAPPSLTSFRQLIQKAGAIRNRGR